MRKFIISNLLLCTFFLPTFATAAETIAGSVAVEGERDYTQIIISQDPVTQAVRARIIKLPGQVSPLFIAFGCYDYQRHHDMIRLLDSYERQERRRLTFTDALKIVTQYGGNHVEEEIISIDESPAFTRRFDFGHTSLLLDVKHHQPTTYSSSDKDAQEGKARTRDAQCLFVTTYTRDKDAFAEYQSRRAARLAAIDSISDQDEI